MAILYPNPCIKIDAYKLYLYIQANSISSLNPKDRNNKIKYDFAFKRHQILKILFEYKKEIIEILGG